MEYSSSGGNVYAKKWLPAQIINPKAIVQISHGMAEHIDRYSDLAEALTDAGYIVCGNDHRGHGKTAGSPDKLGYLADKNGWEKVIDDMYRLTGIIKTENPGLPVFLFGHSMGSYLVRTYIQDYANELQGVILSGTGQNSMVLIDFGIAVSQFEMWVKGKKNKSIRMDKLSFGSFNKDFRPNRTSFDWLNRDNNEVDKYIDDPLCGEIFSAGFFFDLLTGLKCMRKKENNMKYIPKDFPLLFISGDNDPVGERTKGVKKAINCYQKAGLKDIKYKFYPGARHEIMHEINKEEVYQDIISWLDMHYCR